MSPAICLAVVLGNGTTAGSASLDTQGHWHAVRPALIAWTSHAAPLARCIARGLIDGVVPIYPGPPDTSCPKVDLMAVIRADPLMQLCQPDPVIRCEPGQACS